MAYDFSKVNVLIVESTKEMYRLFKDVLVMLDVPERNIHSAFSCEEGFEKFCTGEYDLIITDWLQSPDKGIELIGQIRTNPQSPNNFTPVIMTAGSGHLSRVIKSRDVGVSDYLVKPFAAADLAKRIERVVEKPRPFVLSDNFTGPDRRVRKTDFDFPDRRKEKPDIENH
jgi:DNA-binding response OmpR family regulator